MRLDRRVHKSKPMTPAYPCPKLFAYLEASLELRQDAGKELLPAIEIFMKPRDDRHLTLRPHSVIDLDTCRFPCCRSYHVHWDSCRRCTSGRFYYSGPRGEAV